jgi:hypothetical protein
MGPPDHHSMGYRSQHLSNLDQNQPWGVESTKGGGYRIKEESKRTRHSQKSPTKHLYRESSQGQKRTREVPNKYTQPHTRTQPYTFPGWKDTWYGIFKANHLSPKVADDVYNNMQKWTCAPDHNGVLCLLQNKNKDNHQQLTTLHADLTSCYRNWESNYPG